MPKIGQWLRWIRANTIVKFMQNLKAQVEKAVSAVKDIVAPEIIKTEPIVTAPPPASAIPRPAAKPRVIIVVGQRIPQDNRK